MTDHDATDPSPATPDWFRDAIADVAIESAIEVDGCRIVVRSWGDQADPGVVLVHGGSAHSHWWDHIAPFLAAKHRVVALDLSGHGDSGRRKHYGLSVWAKDLNSVIEAQNFPSPPVIIGHSMGGRVSIGAGSVNPNLAGVAVIDTPLVDRTPEQRAAAEQRAFGPLRIYPERDAAIARFRPVPEQTDVLPYILDHIAQNSLVEVPGGWQWKFDPAMFAGDPDPKDPDPLTCRSMMFGAEYGLVGKHLNEMNLHVLGEQSSFVVIPRASHHIMLDEPRALIASLLTMLAMWDH